MILPTELNPEVSMLPMPFSVEDHGTRIFVRAQGANGPQNIAASGLGRRYPEGRYLGLNHSGE
jgi:hypothetical protein